MANHLHLVGDTPADATWDVGVECEHCGARVQVRSEQSIEALRIELRTQGWFSRDDVDSCPPCRRRVLS